MKKLGFTLLGCMLLFGAFGAGAWANSNLQEIRAYLNGDLKIRVNGQIAQLHDTSGLNVLPITYNGTTYLPVRAVSNVLNVAVDFDAQANEVILGERLDGIAIINEKIAQTQLRTKDPQFTTYGGKDYEEVLYSPKGLNIFTTFLEPQGKYQSLYLQVAAIEENIEFVKIKDHDTGVSYKLQEGITVQDGLVTIQADIAGAKTLVVEVSKSREGGYFIPLTTSYYK